MPRLSGLEVLKILKQEEELREIPVIVMTSDQDAELECLELGALDFLSKPYPQWEIVRARVAKCIELSEDREGEELSAPRVEVRLDVYPVADKDLDVQIRFDKARAAAEA